MRFTYVFHTMLSGGAEFSVANDGSVSFATGPVRIDVAGGWSDTAPISYEYRGAVSDSF